MHEGAGESTLLVMLEPPERAAPRMILPREYIFVVDVLGSMFGEHSRSRTR